MTVVKQERYLDDVSYNIEYTDSADLYQGDYKVTSKGEYGKADVMAKATYVNGEETERTILSSVTLKEPVTEHRLRGTKVRPTWMPTGSVPLAHQRPDQLLLRRAEIPRRHRLHQPQGHRYRRSQRDTHLRRRRRHRDLLRLDERLRLPGADRPRQRLRHPVRSQLQSHRQRGDSTFTRASRWPGPAPPATPPAITATLRCGTTAWRKTR